MLKQKVTFLEQTWKTVEFTAEDRITLDEKIENALSNVEQDIDFEKNFDMYLVEPVNRYPIEEV